MPTYELIIDKAIKKNGVEKFKEQETINVIKASIVSGIFAASLTNCLDVIVIRTQAESGETALQIIKNEGFKLLTKGLGAKLILTSFSSVFFFLTINKVGKIFDTNLSDDVEWFIEYLLYC